MLFLGTLGDSEQSSLSGLESDWQILQSWTAIFVKRFSILQNVQDAKNVSMFLIKLAVMEWGLVAFFQKYGQRMWWNCGGQNCHSQILPLLFTDHLQKMPLSKWQNKFCQPVSNFATFCPNLKWQNNFATKLQILPFWSKMAKYFAIWQLHFLRSVNHSTQLLEKGFATPRTVDWASQFWSPLSWLDYLAANLRSAALSRPMKRDKLVCSFFLVLSIWQVELSFIEH